MSLYERVASTLIGTPFQGPAERLKGLAGLPRRLRHPELKEIFLEGGRAREVLHRAVSDGTNCIDVGAHLGSVLQAIVNLSPKGRHLAIEPIPYKAAWLKKKFPNVEIQQTALGESEGKVDFFINPRKTGFSGMRPHGMTGEPIRLEVDCKRLDNLVPSDRKIGFIKIDVEGAELCVFQGAMRILTESRPIIYFECTRSGLAGFGFSASQIYCLLVDDAQYQIFLSKDWLTGGPALDLAKFETSMLYPFQAFNYVAAPKDR